MVGAEEKSRRWAGAAIKRVAARNRQRPSAKHATGIKSIQFCQNVYGKPGALFSVNRLFRRRSLSEGSRAAFSSAERWSGNPEPTKLRLPNAWEATETGVDGAHPCEHPITYGVIVDGKALTRSVDPIMPRRAASM